MKEESVATSKGQNIHTPDGGKTAAKPTAIPLILSKRRRNFVTAGVMIGMFLSALEATAVSTAMPTVISSLGGLSIYSWVFSAYILTSTVSVPLWGRLSDLYGRRAFYIIGIAIFLMGSVLSGQSNSMPELIAFRAFQGLGGGALLTLGTIIIGDIFSLKQRARVQGLFGGVWGLSSIAGPLIGGFITDYFSWRWVFYLNIPFGIIAALIIGFSLKIPSSSQEKVHLDLRGAVILTTLLTVFLLGLMQISEAGTLKSPSALLMIVASIPLLWLFVSTERGARDPILPLDLFSNQFFKTSAITGFLSGMAMFGAVYFIPLFIQGVLGTTATKTGTTLAPLLLTWVFFSSISGKLMLRFGYRPLIAVGTLIMAIGFSFLSTMNVSTSQGEIIGIMIVLGWGMGLIFVPLILAVQNSVSRNRLGIATSATQLFRLIGATVGVSLMGAVMSAGIYSGSTSLPEDTLSSEISKGIELIVNPATRDSLSPESLAILKQVLAGSLQHVFITGLVIAVLAFLSAFLVPRQKVSD